MYVLMRVHYPAIHADLINQQWKLPARPHRIICKDFLFLGDKLDLPPPHSSGPIERIDPSELERIHDELGISLELITKFNAYMDEDDKVMKRHYTGEFNAM